MNTHTIKRTVRKETVQVQLDDDLFYDAPVGSTIEQVLNAAAAAGDLAPTAPLMAAVCDGKLRELSYPLLRECTLRPVTLASSDGGRIYRRSLTLLVVVACQELLPGSALNIGYAVPDGGYFCKVSGRAPLSPEEVARLEAHMRHIVAAGDPITKTTMRLEDASALFAQRGEADKVRLLEHRERDHLVMYTLRGYTNYYYGYMVPSTAYLTTFRLIWVEGGFILQYPRQENPTELGKLDAYSKLSVIFQKSEDWLERLEIADIGQLNRLVATEKMREIILVSEAQHEQQISDIAQEIARQALHGLKIVTIAGPSSSGKTTFSKRLAIQLLAQGLRPFTMELDNYFVDRELTPRDAEGNYDFENLHAINLPLFNDTLARLLRGEQVQMPRFNFFEGRSEAGRHAQLRDNQIIILEGIHGLNPQLFTSIPKERIYRVYVSALTQLNIDRHNRVPTTDVRLLRRMVRDAHTRGYDAQATLMRWSSVRRGEKRNIFPHQENADALFNSALTYELAALRTLAEPLLMQVEPGTSAHIEANRLLSFLRWVTPLTSVQMSFIPDTSLIREFIGGSILDDYHPGSSELAGD
jgi:uridine kinase